MHEIGKNKRGILRKLFQDYHWHYIPEAILEGQLGLASADDEREPKFAVLELPKLGLVFIGGDPRCPAGREYIANLPYDLALSFMEDGWLAVLKEHHEGKVFKFPRYAFTSQSLDNETLKKLCDTIPTEMDLKQMDIGLARQLGEEESRFSEDHMVNFQSPEDFNERGFGFCILQDGEIICAATTFVVCSRGIEIQINTREEHQRKGLATAAGARLILESLERGLDPNWDAANEISVGLAEKLGYQPQGEYDMYILLDQ
jgi:RimJ/RimL family protein N-acetyltransferase